MTAAVDPTPDMPERLLTSDRLARVESRLGELERYAGASAASLQRLVELSERRDARDLARVDAELAEREAERRIAEAERLERGRWIRSLVSPAVIIPLVTAVGGLIAGLLGQQALSTPHQAPAAATAAGLTEPP